MKFEIYKAWRNFNGTTREWRWRLKARNGEVIASGEGYTTKRKCIQTVELVQDNALQAKILVEGKDGKFS